MNDEDTEILQEFILETRDHLTEIEPDLIQLEQQGAEVSSEIINRVFRAVHSTKGGASFLGLEALKNFSHVFENVLMQLRDKKLVATPDVVDVLLRSVDVLRAMIDDVQNCDQVSCEEETRLLNGIISGAEAAPAPGADSAPSSDQRGQRSPPAGDPVTPPADGVPVEPQTTPVLPVEELSTEPKRAAVDSMAGKPISEPPSPPADAPAPPAAAANKMSKSEVKETLRVKVDLLTRLMNMAGELVLGRNQLLRALDDKADEVHGLKAILQHVDRVTTELQEGIMQTRMQPVGILFSRYTRLVRGIARSLGKEVELEAEGAEVELDKSVIEMLADPLTHVIRNCVDHAIEAPAERQQQGKPRAGKISLKAYHQGGQVNIVVSDDGRGINREKVLQKAIDKGIVNAGDAAKLGPRDIVNLVMAPGFSTAEKISDISGRGVGMDVVRTNIEKLGGQIELDTVEGAGTSVMLRLPLTLAIIPSLVVGVNNERFAVPQVSIVELAMIRAADVSKRIELIEASPVLRIRGRLLPLVRLADLLGIERTYVDPDTREVKPDRRQRIADRRSESLAPPTGASPGTNERRRQTDRRENWQSDYNVLVLRAGTNHFGVIVDELFDMEEIVVKPLSSYLKSIKCFAGTTILGDGRVIMILDPGGIAELSNLRFAKIEDKARRLREERDQARLDHKSIIIFNNADDEVFAVPQDRVLRLERIARKDIAQMGNRQFIKYRGTGLPLIMLNDHLPVKPLPENTEELFLIIPKTHSGDSTDHAYGGIVASQIIDAMDVDVKMQQPFFSGPGVKGTAIIGEQLTLFIDPIELLEAADERREAHP